MAFDIYDGWPTEGSLTDNVKPKDDENIIAGMAVKKDNAGELVKATGAADERVFWAIQNQDDADVEAAGVMPTIVTNAIILTDQFIAGSYTGNLPLEISGTSPGRVQPFNTGEQIPGVYSDGIISRDGVDYLKIVVP